MAAPKKAVGAKSDKIWRDALMRAVHRQSAGSGSPKRIEKIADVVVFLALSGDMQAAKEIGDRLDGRPAQSVAVGQDPNLQPLAVEHIVRPQLTREQWLEFHNGGK